LHNRQGQNVPPAVWPREGPETTARGLMALWERSFPILQAVAAAFSQASPSSNGPDRANRTATQPGPPQACDYRRPASADFNECSGYNNTPSRRALRVSARSGARLGVPARRGGCCRIGGRWENRVETSDPRGPSDRVPSIFQGLLGPYRWKAILASPIVPPAFSARPFRLGATLASRRDPRVSARREAQTGPLARRDAPSAPRPRVIRE
jgi:hypothetical protein